MTDVSEGESSSFLEVLEELVRTSQGLRVEAGAVPAILAGIRDLEEREQRLRQALMSHAPLAPILRNPPGFRLLVPSP